MNNHCRCRWEYNIKVNLQERVCDTDWICPVQDRDQWWALVNMVMNLLGSMKGREFLVQLGDY
jgi:hypothetical protein